MLLPWRADVGALEKNRRRDESVGDILSHEKATAVDQKEGATGGHVHMAEVRGKMRESERERGREGGREREREREGETETETESRRGVGGGGETSVCIYIPRPKIASCARAAWCFPLSDAQGLRH